MAAIATYPNSNPDIGIYGLYNPFALIISELDDVNNLSFKIRVSISGKPGTEVVRNVQAINKRAVVEPFVLLQESYFHSCFDILDPTPWAFNVIKIEVGSQSSTSPELPPIFTEYNASQTKEFYVYNGYENKMRDINHRDFYWYAFEPIKLPKVKREISLGSYDYETLSYPNQFRGFFNNTNSILTATNFITTFHRADGSLLTSTNESLPALPEIGYAKEPINKADISIPPAAAFWKVKIRYTNTNNDTFDSEEITVRRQDCNPKQSNHRLYWVNRYGGDEYQNFTMHADEELSVKRGKRIQSDGINYLATDVNSIRDINNPNLQQFSMSSTRKITLRSDYLNQGEVDALVELFKSPIVIMFDDYGTHPMLVETPNYKITDVKKELYKVEVDLQYANNELQQIR